jgi:hypothetical protein
MSASAEDASMGLYFEEFTLDRSVTTRGRTVSEADMIVLPDTEPPIGKLLHQNRRSEAAQGLEGQDWAAKSGRNFETNPWAASSRLVVWPRSNFAHYRPQAPPAIDGRGKHRPRSADTRPRLLQATPLPAATATGDIVT